MADRDFPFLEIFLLYFVKIMLNQPFLDKVEENLAEDFLKITESTFPKFFSKKLQIFWQFLNF